MPWTLWSWWSLIMSNLIKKSSSCTSDVTIPLWSVKRFANSFGLSFVNVFASRLIKSSNLLFLTTSNVAQPVASEHRFSPGIQALPNHEPMAWMKQPRHRDHRRGKVQSGSEAKTLFGLLKMCKSWRKVLKNTSTVHWRERVHFFQQLSKWLVNLLPYGPTSRLEALDAAMHVSCARAFLPRLQEPHGPPTFTATDDKQPHWDFRGEESKRAKYTTE